MNTQIIKPQPVLPRIKVPPHPVWPQLSEDEKYALKQRIKQLLHEHNAVLVAHYYVDGELQALAEETGGCVADSLEMARYGTTADAYRITDIPPDGHGGIAAMRMAFADAGLAKWGVQCVLAHGTGSAGSGQGG